jgi:hypothetical protein
VITYFDAYQLNKAFRFYLTVLSLENLEGYFLRNTHKKPAGMWEHSLYL